MNTVRQDIPRRHKERNYTQIIFISFIMVIVTGTLLLLLPISQGEGVAHVSLIDALFTATSAVCVTGLVTVTTAVQWSLFGQLVIMFLIQIGGLSFIGFYAYFMIYMGKKITLDDRLLIQATFNQSTIQGMVKMILLIIRGTLLVEGIGAFILFLFFKIKEKLPLGKAVFFGIFHSISGFCNGGFDVIGETNLMPFVHSLPVNLVIMSLIVTGGIGFVVWKEIISYWHHRQQRKKFKFSLHCKMALTMTASLIALGALYFFFFEGNNPETMGSFSVGEKIVSSFFQSVTLRTAGFSTIPQGNLRESSKFVSSIFMIIGGSPGGTAGGIKTVTIGVLFASVWSTLKGRNGIVIGERNVSMKTLQKALTITMIMISLLLGITGILSVTEANSLFPHTFIDLLYEAASALGTVGLTTGITPFLSFNGKIIVSLCMLTGRLGPLTIFYSLSKNMIHSQDLITFPTEDILIG